MTPHKQLLDHDPANGVYGDCYRTAIGCLLDMAPTEVPHFCLPDAEEDWLTRRDAWLTEQGWAARTVIFCDEMEVTEVLRLAGRMLEDYYLLGGNTAEGVAHVVICRGSRVVHDTSSRNVGVTRPLDPSGFDVMYLVPHGL